MQHSLHILDLSGDTVMTFDPTDEAQVEEVRKAFDQIVGAEKGLAYTVQEDGASEVTRDFNDVLTAPKTIVTRQMVGG